MPKFHVIAGPDATPAYPIVRKIGPADLKDALAKGVDESAEGPVALSGQPFLQLVAHLLVGLGRGRVGAPMLEVVGRTGHAHSVPRPARARRGLPVCDPIRGKSDSAVAVMLMVSSLLSTERRDLTISRRFLPPHTGAGAPGPVGRTDEQRPFGDTAPGHSSM